VPLLDDELELDELLELEVLDELELDELDVVLLALLDDERTILPDELLLAVGLTLPVSGSLGSLEVHPAKITAQANASKIFDTGSLQTN
jgi:hypothetical protein